MAGFYPARTADSRVCYKQIARWGCAGHGLFVTPFRFVYFTGRENDFCNASCPHAATKSFARRFACGNIGATVVASGVNSDAAR